jgi:NAD(P)-dependent dehydrogenase (short-subunit alcohol dehydrogenase family)
VASSILLLIQGHHPFATRAQGARDILVNDAGRNNPQSIEAVEDEDWDPIVALNLTSCMRLPAPWRPSHWGRIIFISSILG